MTGDNESSGGSLPDFLKPWLAFARQKLDEIRLLADLMEDEVATDVFSGLAQHLKALDSRQNSQQLLNEDVRARVDSYAVRQLSRPESFAERNSCSRSGCNCRCFQLP